MVNFQPKRWTTSDSESGCWQIILPQSAKTKASFHTPPGQMSFNRMYFWPSGSAAHFAFLMPRVLDGLIGDSCLAYLQDMIICACNQVSVLMSTYNLVILGDSRSKCFRDIRGADFVSNEWTNRKLAYPNSAKRIRVSPKNGTTSWYPRKCRTVTHLVYYEQHCQCC